MNDDIFVEVATRELALRHLPEALHDIKQAAKAIRDTAYTPSHGVLKGFFATLANYLGEKLRRDKDAEEALKRMRILASTAIDLADRCHGGHSYQSLGSREEGKCCEVRSRVDELKREFVELSREQAAAEGLDGAPEK